MQKSGEKKCHNEKEQARAPVIGREGRKLPNSDSPFNTDTLERASRHLVPIKKGGGKENSTCKGKKVDRAGFLWGGGHDENHRRGA